jgi:hypothetical protein
MSTQKYKKAPYKDRARDRPPATLLDLDLAQKFHGLEIFLYNRSTLYLCLSQTLSHSHTLSFPSSHLPSNGSPDWIFEQIFPAQQTMSLPRFPKRKNEADDHFYQRTLRLIFGIILETYHQLEITSHSTHPYLSSASSAHHNRSSSSAHRSPLQNMESDPMELSPTLLPLSEYWRPCS